MTGIDRDAARQFVDNIILNRVIGVGTNDPSGVIVDYFLELIEPATLTRDRLRTELAASLPADPKWVAWVDGVLERLEVVEGVTLTPEEARFLAADVRAWVAEHRPDPFNGARLALAARLEATS